MLLLAIHAGVLAWIGAVHSPTLDEVAHLPSGLSHWLLGKYDLYYVNPPLVRMIAAIPLLFLHPNIDWAGYHGDIWTRREFTVGENFMEINQGEIFWYFTLARWACIPISLLGASVCHAWGRDLFGGRAGLFAAALWCFSPTVLGNAAMITPDTGAAAFGVAAAYAFWRWLKSPRWSLALLAGVTLGLAELSKTLWIIAFALWPVMWHCWQRWSPEACGLSRREKAGRVGQLAAILLLGYFVLLAGYRFEGVGTRLKDFTFCSQTLNGKPRAGEVGNRFTDTAWENLPVPLPRNFLRGIDMQKSDFERLKWSYLRGEQKLGGWWYYYLYAIAVKEPLGTLLCGLLAVVATTLAVTAARRNVAAESLSIPPRWFGSSQAAGLIRDWRSEIVLLLPGLAVLLLVSSQTGFNRYLRYILPAYPFALIWIGQVVGTRGRAARWMTPLACGLGIWTAASSLYYAPHSQSYFNELAGGPLGGPAHLLDANVDWGQDLLHLRRWIEEHPQAEPMHISYFGFIKLHVLGLGHLPESPSGIPTRAIPYAPDEALGPWPGWHAVSVNYVHGYKHYENDEPKYTYFQKFRPVARAGYSIYIYHVSLDEANAVREKRGLATLSYLRPPRPLHPQRNR